MRGCAVSYYFRIAAFRTEAEPGDALPCRRRRGPLLGIAERARGELRHLPVRWPYIEIALRRLFQCLPVAFTPGKPRLPAFDFHRIGIDRACAFHMFAARRQIVRGIGILGALQMFSDAGR